MDDFKARIGGQIEVLEIGGFSLSASIMGNFRRYESALVRISSFGAELSAVAGYYTPGWYLAGELGFDKSIISNLKHSDIMKDSFNEINDGWYIPSGGHYIYGVQAGKRLGRSMEITLRAGLTNAQGGHLDALLPYYAQIGIIKVF